MTFLLGATLFLFASLRIYDHGRVIQMNMEIALILAHCCLLLPDFSDPEAENIPMVSILLIRDTVVESCYRRFGSETIQKFTSMKLLQMPCVIT